jgi:hypothetical protein
MVLSHTVEILLAVLVVTSGTAVTNRFFELLHFDDRVFMAVEVQLYLLVWESFEFLELKK